MQLPPAPPPLVVGVKSSRLSFANFAFSCPIVDTSVAFTTVHREDIRTQVEGRRLILLRLGHLYTWSVSSFGASGWPGGCTSASISLIFRIVSRQLKQMTTDKLALSTVVAMMNYNSRDSKWGVVRCRCGVVAVRKKLVVAQK
jgi:hypothetical protein